MTDEEKLIKTRNFIRYLFRKMDNEFDIKCRNNSRFFFDCMERAAEVGVIEERHGTYRMTPREQIPNPHKRARHLGAYPHK